MVNPHAPSRRRFVLWLLGFLALVLLLAAFVLRPSPVLGVNGAALQRSFAGFIGGSGRPCDDLGDRLWKCRRMDEGLSGTVEYRVKVNSLGCWQARRVGYPDEGSPRHLSGCITMVDVIFG